MEGAESDSNAGPIDDSDSEQSDLEPEPGPERPCRKGTFFPAPTLEQVEDAVRDLQDILKPPRTSTSRPYKDPSMDKKSRKRLEDMRTFCLNFIRLEKGKQASGSKKNCWTLASVETAQILGYAKKNSTKPGTKKARELRKWVQAFIADREEIPICNWQASGRSLIDDEDFAQEINLHLQSLKPEDVHAEAIVNFLDNPEILARLKRKKTISIRTGQTWIKKNGLPMGIRSKRSIC